MSGGPSVVRVIRLPGFRVFVFLTCYRYLMFGGGGVVPLGNMLPYVRETVTCNFIRSTPQLHLLWDQYIRLSPNDRNH